MISEDYVSWDDIIEAIGDWGGEQSTYFDEAIQRIAAVQKKNSNVAEPNRYNVLADVGERLLPCPFCGSEAKIFGPDENKMWGIVCQQPETLCNVRLLYCHSKEEAIQQWNKRANVS